MAKTIIEGDDPTAAPVDDPAHPPVTFLNDKGESVTVPALPKDKPKDTSTGTPAPRESPPKAN